MLHHGGDCCLYADWISDGSIGSGTAVNTAFELEYDITCIISILRVLNRKKHLIY